MTGMNHILIFSGYAFKANNECIVLYLLYALKVTNFLSAVYTELSLILIQSHSRLNS